MTRARILVVEDEIVSRLFMVRTLQTLDYQVVATASTGEEAIECADQTNLDLIIMDIGLGGSMNGAEAAKIICAQHRINCLFISAYTRDELSRRYSLPESFHYLSKPLLGDQLQRKIEEILTK